MVSVLAVSAALAAIAAGCGDSHATGTAAEDRTASQRTRPLTVYSGRSESLVAPLFRQFTERTGIAVGVRYGDTAELAATLLEEGVRTPADVFFSQDAAALGALAEAGSLRELPADVVALVAARFTSGPDRRWVGVSGRARAVVHDTARLAAADLPQSLEEVAHPRFAGRFGVAPSNASFQAHMAVYRVARGAAALDALLAGIASNQPRLYASNGPIVDAVIAGEIDWGLVNHYYVWRATTERPGAPAASFFMPEGEASSFINVAGVGVLGDRPEAIELVRFLLSPESQRYFAAETFEYPLLEGAEPAAALPPLAEVRTPEVDFGEVSAVLEETLAAIRKSGLLR
ncbi:MAG TPA: extracellular solute-binding protein [Thermoanaerobaculia bacterium]|nr:extracellular solute-binding protein [Thermoanaerobaculia bacterium]